MKRTLSSIILLGIVFPVVVCFTVYYGFRTDYTRFVFDEAGFRQQYEGGIYKYRVLGRTMLLGIHELISADPQSSGSPVVATREGTQRFDPVFYRSYFYLNAFSLVLGCLVLNGILGSGKSFVADPAERDVALVLFALTSGLTQFVVTPYDQLSYVTILAGIYLAYRYVATTGAAWFVTAVAVIVISTLTRESAIVIVAAAIALLLTRYGLNRQCLLPAAGFLLSFLITYLALRLFYGLDRAVIAGVLFPHNLTGVRGALGVAFWICGLFLIWKHTPRENTRLVLLFILLSSPYMFLCVLTGSLFELRLAMPIFLGSFLLSRTAESVSTA